MDNVFHMSFLEPGNVLPFETRILHGYDNCVAHAHSESWETCENFRLKLEIRIGSRRSAGLFPARWDSENKLKSERS